MHLQEHDQKFHAGIGSALVRGRPRRPRAGEEGVAGEGDSGKEIAGKEPRARPVQIEMKNVQLHADEGIVLDVRQLLGKMISQSAGSPPIFDDQRSYVIDVAAAEIAIDSVSLQNLMNHSVLGENAPLRTCSPPSGTDASS